MPVRSPQRGRGGTEPGTTSLLQALDILQWRVSDLPTGEADKVEKTVRTQVLARVDTSAKRIRFDGTESESYAKSEFFCSRLDAEGGATHAWMDVHGCHPQLFRPDYDPEKDVYTKEIGR